MLSEVMEHYGLALPFDEAGFFETEHHQKIIKQMKAAIQAGRLVALSGVVGAGKTVLAHRLQPAFPRCRGLRMTRCADSAMEIRDIAAA